MHNDKKISKSRRRFGIVICLLAFLSWVFYEVNDFLHPSDDKEFVDALHKAQAVDERIFVANIQPGDWDTVCYLQGGPTRVSRDIGYYIGLPDDVKFNVTDGYDVITDDEYALVFLNTKKFTAVTKTVTFQPIDTFPKDKLCFKDQSKAYFEVKKATNPNNKKFNRYILKELNNGS